MDGIFVLVASVLPIATVYKLLAAKVLAGKALDVIVKAKGARELQLVTTPTRSILVDTSFFRDKDGNLCIGDQQFKISSDGKILITVSEENLEDMIEVAEKILFRISGGDVEYEDLAGMEAIIDALKWERETRRKDPRRKPKKAKL